MSLPKSTVKDLMKNALEGSEVTNIGKDSIEYMIKKMEEFCVNLTKNSIGQVKSHKMKTLLGKHLNETLDKTTLILQNIVILAPLPSELVILVKSKPF